MYFWNEEQFEVCEPSEEHSELWYSCTRSACGLGSHMRDFRRSKNENSCTPPPTSTLYPYTHPCLAMSRTHCRRIYRGRRTVRVSFNPFTLFLVPVPPVAPAVNTPTTVNHHPYVDLDDDDHGVFITHVISRAPV